MAIVAGFDVHRRQITFDALDTETGELSRGRIDSSPAAVLLWSERWGGREVHVAVEACTVSMISPLSMPWRYTDVMPRLLCPSWRWMTISGTPSRAISTAWAWRS